MSAPTRCPYRRSSCSPRRLSLSYRLFGTSEDFRILSYQVSHYTGARLTHELELVATPDPTDAAFDQFPAGDGTPDALEVFDDVLADLAPGMNVLEWFVDYANGETRRLLALVVLSTAGAGGPQITHIGTGTGPVAGEARVHDLVTITGVGFGDRQAEPGVGIGQALFGAGVIPNPFTPGIPAGTVFRWSENRIEVRVPAGSHEAAVGDRVFVTTAAGLSAARYPFAVLPRENTPSAWDDQTCQFVGEGQYEAQLRYNKDADIADFDQDGDLDIYSPVSQPTPDSDEVDDVIHVNEIQTETDTTWTRPLAFSKTFQRVTNRANDNFCGVDQHIVTGQITAIYESVAVDVDNDGDLDIVAPRGRTTCESADGDCDDMNWIRLSLNQAARSSSFQGDFFFIDQSETRVFNATNEDLLSPPALQERVYDDVYPGDLDGDGDIDLIFGNRDRQGLADVTHPNLILVNEGFAQGGTVGFFKAQEIGNADDVSHDARFIDFDQDGDQDVLLVFECRADNFPACNAFGSPGIALHRNLFIDGGAIGSADPIEFEDATSEVAMLDLVRDGQVSAEIVDLDGDSYPEAILVPSTGVVEAIILRNTAGQLTAEVFDETDPAYSILAADINQDGYPDILTTTLSNNRWPHIFLNDGAGSLLQPPITAGDEPFWFDPDAAAKVEDDVTVADYEVSGPFHGTLAGEIGDLDGDGRMDFYFSQSEQDLVFYIPDPPEGVHEKADEDRIYLGRAECP